MYLPEITLALFSIFNILRLGSYLPQILRVAADNEGAKAISYSTWSLWIGANASTAAYAVVNIADMTLFIVSAMNAIGCALVVGLTALKRRRHAEGGRIGTRMSKFTPIDDRLYAYMLAHEPPEHEQLRALREHTERLPNGRMQITPEQGHLLALLVGLMGARRVLEIGTFTGYSAMAMALGLPIGGRLVACDISEKWTRVARTYWQRAGVEDKIDLHIAPALDTLALLEARSGADQFDLAFIDADKLSYDSYYEGCLRLVRPGGLIVLDNMLRRGRVADPLDADADTLALRAMNSKVVGDERIDRVLLPIASGMTLARRRDH